MKILSGAVAALLLTAAGCVPLRPAAEAAPPVGGSAPPADRSKSDPAGGPPRPVACVLAQGADSQVETAFVGLIRDDAAYAALARRSGLELPTLEPAFFPTGVVVAAFLGARPTPGYRVSIERDGDAFRVEEETPPRDAILAQVVTRPFVVTAYAEAPPHGLVLDPGSSVGPAIRRLGITRGQFDVAGGIADTQTIYTLGGEIRVATMGELKTFLWDLTGTDPAGAAPPARFQAATTFVATPGGRFAVELPDFGSFVPPPCQGVRMAGIVGGEGPKIIAEFETRGCAASDSYGGSGKFKAAPLDPPSP